MTVLRLNNGTDRNGNKWPEHYVQMYEQYLKDVERATKDREKDDYLKDVEYVFVTAQARRYYIFVSNSIEIMKRTVN